MRYDNKLERNTKKKNINKISKRSIIAILTLCVLLGITATCVNVFAMDEVTTIATEETSEMADEIPRELAPRMAKKNCDPLVKIFGSNYTVTSTSGPWQHISGANGITGA